MSKKFELITKDFLDNADLIIKEMSPEQAASLKIQAKKIKKIDEKLDEKLLNSKADRYIEGNLAVLVTRTQGTKDMNVVDTRINFDKAIEYAKKNNLHIPTTIPQIDYDKLQNELWFQEHLEEFQESYTKLIPGKKPVNRVSVIALGKKTN